MIRAGLFGRRAAILLTITIAAATVTKAGQPSAKRPYFPARGKWQKKEPSAVGLDKAKLSDAIAFAMAHENPNTKDLSVAIVNQFRSEAPFNTLIGPTQPRAGSNGVIIRHGVVAAEWGDTSRADMAAADGVVRERRADSVERRDTVPSIVPRDDIRHRQILGAEAEDAVSREIFDPETADRDIAYSFRIASRGGVEIDGNDADPDVLARQIAFA